MIETCPVCGENNTKLVFQAKPLDYSNNNLYDIGRCAVCGHGFTVAAKYSAADYEGGSYDVKEKFWHGLITPLLINLEKSKIRYFRKSKRKTTRILEIGSGKGRFIKTLIGLGYLAYGIEPSKRSFQVARSLGCETIFNCTIQEMGLVPSLAQKYDIIILWHVLEHLEDPGKNLFLLQNFLEQNGQMIIAVPNFASWQATTGKSNWYHLDPSRHISHFAPRSISILAQRNSLEVKQIFFNSFYQNCVGEIITFTNKLLPYKNIAFNVPRLNRNFFKKTGKAGAAFWFFIACIITIVSIPFLIVWTFITQWKKKSGTMVVVTGNLQSKNK